MLVLDMFKHVEKADSGDRALQEAGVAECRADHVANASADGVGGADGSGFHEHDFKPGPLEGAGHEAVAASDVEDGSRRGKETGGFQDEGIAVTKPERGVFDGEVDVVAGLGIRHRGDGAGGPDAIGGKIEIGRDFGQWAHSPVYSHDSSGASGKKNGRTACAVRP